MKRWLLIGALTLSALVSTGLGVGWATFRTEVGREVLTDYLSSALDSAVQGTVDIGSIDGSMLEGLVIEDLVIRDTEGVLLARLPRVVARYRLADLVSRRIVLGQIIVTDPHVNILKRQRGGRFNYQEVLGLGGEGDGRPAPLIAFEDAEIHRATVEIRTPSDPLDPDDRHVVEETEHGLMRYRRIDGLTARLNYARISSPSEPGLRFDVQQLEATFSDPGLDIRALRGRIDIDGDSLTLDLDEVRLPGSDATLEGFLKWPTGKLEFGLDIDAHQWAVDDLESLTRRLPWGMHGTGRIRLSSPNPDSMSILVDPLRLQGGGGGVRGRVEVTVSQKQIVEFRGTDLSFQNLSLDYLRPLLDTIPLAGRLTGALTAHGPTNLLNASVDWTFTDSLVPDWPDSYVRGEGFMSLGGSGTTFLNFLVDSARIDLGTLRRLFPSIDLLGHVGGAGNVTGLWRNAGLNGRLWHQFDSLPVSRASGALRFDSRTDTLGVYADLGFDSLHLVSVRPSYPSLPPAGVVGGRVALNGPLDSIAFEVSLAGSGGRTRGRGALTLTTARLSVSDLDAEFSNFNAADFYPGLPSTELFGTVRGSAAIDSGRAGHSAFDVTLVESFLADAPLDSGSARVGVTDSVLRAEALLWGPGVLATAQGTFGLAPTRDDESLLLRAAIDSLGSIAPLLTSLSSVLESESLLVNLVGSARIDVGVRGSRERFTTEFDLVLPQAFSDAGMTEGVRVTAKWSTGFDAPMIIDGEVDSLALGSFAFSDLALKLEGTRGRSDWFARARMGVDGSAVGWGKAFADGQVLVLPLDSVAVLLPSNVWMLNHPAVVSVSDSGLLFSQFTLVSVVDPRSPAAVACHDRRPAVTLEGLFPTNGSAALVADLVAVPVKDLWGVVQGDPSWVDGHLCGTVELGGTALSPVATSAITLLGGRVGNVNIPQMTGQADYRARRLKGAYVVRDGDDLITEIDFSLPVDLALRDVEERRGPDSLFVSARADSVDMRFLGLLTETVTDAGGTLYADFGVRGSWEDPILTGTVSVVDGIARYPELGATHRGVTGGAHLSGDSIIIDSLRAESGDGVVSVSGSIRLDGLRRPLVDVRFTASEFHTANIAGLVDFTTSGTVDLRGPVLGASLTGSGTVTDGVLYFADLIEKEIINLEDTLYAELLDPELRALIQREGLGADFENRFLDSLRIDGLQLQMGPSMWLRSSQANVQLEGGLTINKLGDTYRYEGTLNTTRGSYRLPFFGASKDFAVTNGEVVYFGTPDLNAVLNINAEHLVRTVRGDNINVFVNIGGTLNEPVVTLTSDREPPLPVSEIISYLLVGAPRVETAFAGTAANAPPLGALGPAFNAVVGEVSSQVERALISDLGVPIDYLRVRWEGVSGAELSFGRRLGDQWFFIANPSVCWQELNQRVAAAAGRIEYRFADEWSWSFSRDPGTTCGTSRYTSQIGSRYQLGVDLLWKRRY